MPIRTFRITGTVTSLSTKKPVEGLRLEAWDRDSERHTVYGSGISDRSGRFTIPADVDIPGGVVGPIPAVLKAFMDDRAIELSGDIRIENLIVQDSPLRVVANVAAIEPEKRDRVNFDQVESFIDFVRLSDFKGVYREGRDRLGTAVSLGGKGLRSALSGIKLEPIKPPETRSKDIVTQDPATAQRRLAEREITVTAVKPYNEADGLLSIGSLPSDLRKGDKVELYEQNGVVKAYKIVKPTQTTTGNVDVNRLDQEIVKLRSDLQARDQQIATLRNDLVVANQAAAGRAAEVEKMAAEVKRISTEKDQQVASLSRELTTLETEQDKIANDRLRAIEEKLRRIP